MKRHALGCKENDAAMCKDKCAAMTVVTVPDLERYWHTIPIMPKAERQMGLDNAIILGIIIFTYMPKRPADAKLQSLRGEGCLNSRPESVTDELFIGNEFFDSRDMAQVKYEMLRRVGKDGRSISEAAMRFGFSRPTFYQANAAFEAGGVAGLVPRKRGPKQAHKLTAEVIGFIGQARQEDPSLKTHDLVNRIRERFDLGIHPRTIERSLARHQKKR